MFADNRLTEENQRTVIFLIWVTSREMKTTDVTVGRQRHVYSWYYSKPLLPQHSAGSHVFW